MRTPHPAVAFWFYASRHDEEMRRTRGETVPCFSCSGTRMPALFPTVRVSVPCTLFSRPTKCVCDNYFSEKNIFTNKNETSESPSAKNNNDQRTLWKSGNRKVRHLKS